MRHSIRLLLALMTLLVLAGCSRDRTLSCAEPTRYQGSVSAPPLRIPDDLNVPDEAPALRIPDEIEPIDNSEDQSCLESPPDFFEGQRQNG